MRNERTPRGREPSIHESALQNLRRGGKAAAILVGSLFLLMALFAGIGALMAKQSIPARPTKPPQAQASSGETSGRGRNSGANSETLRKQVSAFLEAAAPPRKRTDPGKWLPGSDTATERFTYTTRSVADPGTREKGDTAWVRTNRLNPAEKKTLFDSVSDSGKLLPDTLSVSRSSGSGHRWTLHFVVKTKHHKWREGVAAGYEGPDGRTIIDRLTYGN